MATCKECGREFSASELSFWDAERKTCRQCKGGEKEEDAAFIQLGKTIPVMAMACSHTVRAGRSYARFFVTSRCLVRIKRRNVTFPEPASELQLAFVHHVLELEFLLNLMPADFGDELYVFMLQLNGSRPREDKI